jgi:acetyltransferase-like isoleucine patch superfamily enzyme
MKIHPLADVQTVNIGENTTVWQFCVILSGAIIGKHCNINCNVFIENEVTIGDSVTVKSGVQLWDGTSVEDNVFIGPNVTFTNNPYPRSKEYPNKHVGPIIRRGASIGANSTILGGVEIGEYCLIGAGSVVTKNVPPHTVWYGNPASHKGFITKTGILLDMNLKSKEGQEYKFKGNSLELK